MDAILVFDLIHHESASQRAQAIDRSQHVQDKFLIVLHIGSVYLEQIVIVAGYVIALRDLRDILDDVEDLQDILDDYEPVLQDTLKTVSSLSTSAIKTIRDTQGLISDTEALMKSTGATLDDGTKQTLEGLAAVLRSTAKTMGTAGQIKDAKSSICDIIEDTWDEYTGDVNNLLLMDATAEAVSLTDSRNPSPESIQILIRTQEITMPDEDETEAEAAAEVQTTFWGRVAQMFKDFWAAITGLFGGKD